MESLAQSAPIEKAPAGEAPKQESGKEQRTLESHQRYTADAPLCMTCGTKMRPAGSCYVCEGCGSTSGCS